MSKKVGTCGRLRSGAQVAVADSNDFELDIGETGQLLVRDNTPWSLSHGYYKDPSATASAWRNGWFHTGDVVRRDEDGDYFYVDRLKDVIRRRGENISSFEVEKEIMQYPGVDDAAAIGLPSEFGEDDVMIVLSPIAGQTVDPRALIEFLIPRMPHFMVPRYIRILDALPRTPTMKVQKTKLREDGVTADTFDRENAGMQVRGHRFLTR